MKVALMVIATRKYARFVMPLWTSAYKHLLPNHDRHLILFADARQGIVESMFIQVDHLPWPGMTLKRYHFMLSAKPILQQFDYIYYVDADALFVNPVGDEILSDLVAVHHPGFYKRERESFTYETRPQSRAYIPPDKGSFYVAGGFQGGKASRFIEAMETMRDWIDEDESKGIVPRFHDESIWNAYCLQHQPTLILDPSYLTPEEYATKSAKLLALQKDHRAMREP